MHLLTTASIEHLSDLRGGAVMDSRRFRPTAVIETYEGSGFLEKEWIGRHLRLGTIDLTAQEETKRCGITLISQPGFDEDPDVLRTILRHNKRNLGIYCSIDNLGSIQLGDTLSIGE